MSKVKATIIMDEDVFDELQTFPGHRVEILDVEYKGIEEGENKDE